MEVYGFAAGHHRLTQEPYDPLVASSPNTTRLDARALVQENIDRHNRVAKAYETGHTEINNPTEQRRLRQTLRQAVEHINTKGRKALDFGAGTGNVAGKLLDLGFEVCAADVSAGMLDVLAHQFRTYAEAGVLRRQELTGEFPLPFRDGEFAFVASYSVLHHVPDYLAAVRELMRVLAPGGVLFIDHELSADHWRSPFGVRVHRALCMPRYAISRIVARGAALLGHREPPLPPPGQREINDEGDIHIYADDCIDWTLIRHETIAAGLVEIPFPEYLLCRERSPIPIRHLLCRRFAKDMGIYVGIKQRQDSLRSPGEGA